MKCKSCGSENVSIQLVKTNRRESYGSIKQFLAVVLSRPDMEKMAIIPIIGWIPLIFIYLRGYKVETDEYAICQKCGCKWKI